MGQDAECDVIVVDSGQARGQRVTAFARAGGKRAPIELEHVSGSCINAGCVPARMMIVRAVVSHMALCAAD